jgi:hypothetical protein
MRLCAFSFHRRQDISCLFKQLLFGLVTDELSNENYVTELRAVSGSLISLWLRYWNSDDHDTRK